ncbi:MAG: CapA family protein [Gemmatimonadetes bacterium]|nr:CapA family protein [Gemmatimonadota bacterium]
MTGRGVDQVLPSSVDPALYESYVRDARDYVRLAERENGAIPAPVPFDYIWGAALDELERVRPDARIINLETAVTTASEPWPGKGIHYRMHPANVPVLTAAGVDVCVLGNNHVMDWGRTGLLETLSSLRAVGIGAPGAGTDLEDAAAPAVIETGRGRVSIHSWGVPDAGVPLEWRAGPDQPGVNLLPSLDSAGADRVIAGVEARHRPGDRVVVSIHWGTNWGYTVPDHHREFAHRLIDSGVVDLVHGHSSHHPRPIELYRDRLILYGAGDFLNDYEGIGGKDAFRGDLSLMYFPRLAATGAWLECRMAPMRIRRFRLQPATGEEAEWLASTLDRESRPFGARVQLEEDGRLSVEPAER